MLPGPIRSSFETLSEHVVYTSQLYADLRSRVIAMESAMIDFSGTPQTPADQRALAAASLLRPFAVDPGLVRIGGDGDGGYVMAEIFDVAAAISVGVGPDVSWDADVASRGLRVAMFDPTVAEPPSTVPRSAFHRIGLGTAEQASESRLDLRPLDDLITLAGAEYQDALLKIDIEGAEWRALEGVRDFGRFPQVALEMHDLGDLRHEIAGDRIVTVLKTLHTTHVPFHVHANNECPVVRFGRFWLPDALEVSYLRRDLAGAFAPATELHTSFDRASNARFTDIDLTGLLTAPPY
jgi:hypothetical protein